ncbi:S-layer homology domain-containing protein [Paenibacillus puerhi]|uniref:S-layer homology domain-containing protein n=1 Tax=Paenibacillus puerhi TaxID=2692622 RepID=UPI00135AB888
MLTSFKDTADISSYARESVAALVKAGYLEGYDGGVHPNQPMTRVQAAVMIAGVLGLKYGLIR